MTETLQPTWNDKQAPEAVVISLGTVAVQPLFGLLEILAKTMFYVKGEV